MQVKAMASGQRLIVLRLLAEPQEHFSFPLIHGTSITDEATADTVGARTPVTEGCVGLRAMEVV